MPTNAGNGVYNFGAGDSTAATDRAIGFISSSVATKSGNLYAYFNNGSGGALSSLTISYNVEKYRKGLNAAGFSVQLYYSFDGATWTSAGSNFLTSFAADADNTGYTPSPGATQSISNQTLTVAIPSGSDFYLAWNYAVTSGTTTSNAQALSIDDFYIMAIAATNPSDPSGVGAADPSSVVIGYTTPLLTVAVTPGSSPASTGLDVACDLTAIGGSAAQALFDDGSNGDLTSGDHTFSFLASVASSTTTGAKVLPCTVSDDQTRTANAPIALTASHALPISKTAPATIDVNQVLTYTLTVKNNLPVAASDLVITDSLPLSATFSSASHGGVLLPGNEVSWSEPSLASGISISRTVRITAPAMETTLPNVDYGAWASNWLTRTTGSPVNTTVRDPSLVTPIATARAAGVGWTGKLRGNVTVPPGIYRPNAFVIQDGTGGMYIYTPTSMSLPPMVLGDVVQIIGTIKNYNGLLETDPTTSVTWIDSGSVPAPEIIATSALTGTQGKLIEVSGTAILTKTISAPGVSDYWFKINDGSAPVWVFIDKDTQIDLAGFTSPMPMRVIGFSGRYNAAQIMPRFQSDLVDLRAPAVTGTSPVDGSTGASPYFPVTATFNKEMSASSINETSFTLTGPEGAVSGSVSYNAATHTASFTPGAALSPLSVYTALLTADVKDINDIPMALFTWSFTTGAVDTTPPTITGRSPLPDATGVSLTANIVVSFSEDLHPSSLNQSHFILEGPYGVMPAALGYDSVAHVVTLDPNTRLLPTTLYTMTVTGATADWAGLTLGADDVWSFETSIEPPMHVYFGDLHNHTGYSDGSGTPTQALAAGKAAGFNFMAITDHSYAIDNDEWANTLSAVETATGADFLALRGFEYTQGAEGHINVYNTERHAVRTNTGCSSCDFTPNLEPGVTVQGFYQWLAITGTVGLDGGDTVMQFNHPGWINFNDWTYHPEVSAVARLEEVGNGNGSSYMFSEDEFIRSLDYGWKVGATNNADTHSAYWGLNTDHRTGVLMSELTKSALLEALRERRTFASEDKNYTLRMKANGAWMGSEIANSGVILFEIDGSDPDGELTSLVQLITDQGKVVAQTEPGIANFTWQPQINLTTGVHYFYVKVTQTDGERIVTSPVWTTGEEDIAITDIVIQPTVPTIYNPSLLTVRVTNRIELTRTVTVTLDVNGLSIEPAVMVTVPPNNDAYANFSWQPSATGEVTVTADLEGAPATDNPDDNHASINLTVTDEHLPLILIDAGKGNTNAVGREFRMFIDDLSAHRYNVLKNLDTLTAADLDPSVVKLLIITAPQYAYSTAEQNAIADFVAAGGSLWLCGLSDYTGKVPWADTVADRLNAILASIETKTGQTIQMRVNDDEVMDADDNNGYVFGVRWSNFPSALSGAIPTSIGVNVESITSWSLNSLRDRSGGALTDSDGVQIVVQGDLDEGYGSAPWYDANHTYNEDADAANDAYIYNPTWISPASMPPGAIPLPMAAVTQLSGNAGRIMLYGDSSDAFTTFAYTAGDGLQNELFNLQSVMWLLGQPLTKSTIAEARLGGNDPVNLDRLVWVEGEITAAYGEFFNVLYVQDETGGITVHAPAGDIDPSAFSRGTKVRVVGTVGSYNGDTEIEFFEAEMVQVIGSSSGEPQPLPFSTQDAAVEENQGWLGVITGTVTAKTGNDTLIVDDGSGPVRVFLDGYNGNFDDIQVNDWVRVTGLLSEDGDGGRIRVRNHLMHTPSIPDDVTIWDALDVTGFDLQTSFDQTTWAAVTGSWGSGYTLQLDPTSPFQYLNLENLVTNRPLQAGYYPFYVDAHPSEWFAYWAGRGVVSGASGWQGWMWQIINGDQPIFYLKVTDDGSTQSFMLVDGLTKDFFSTEAYLRVDGTYLAGAYTFKGTVKDPVSAPFEIAVDIDFLARYYIPIVINKMTP